MSQTDKRKNHQHIQAKNKKTVVEIYFLNQAAHLQKRILEQLETAKFLLNRMLIKNCSANVEIAHKNPTFATGRLVRPAPFDSPRAGMQQG